ncbi:MULTISPECIES: ShlB/FhaC/HecB family hemolysin secretion/activation protein [Polaromonas]|uniref:ShlB/FhaC/HecB family hemolysin secretion/activation protein n=1 Tax=Polaromonas aquatica TaxID=332657 RepID=A0ABW1TU79_9BURK
MKHHCAMILAGAAILGAGAPRGALAQAGGGNPLDTLPVAPRIEIRPGGVVSPPVAAPTTAQQVMAVRLTPARFDIEGVQSIPFAEVSSRFAPLAHREITVGQLVEVAREITQLYQDRGYALSFCYVPTQDFKDGIVRIVAVEGHVSEVRIEGDAGNAEPKIREMAARIQADKPLRRATFERYVGLLGQLPGLRVQANALPPSNTDGATVMTLKVTRRPVTASASVDARQSRPRLLLTGSLNDAIFSGSQLSASVIASPLPGETFQSAQFTQFIGSNGLSARIDASHYRGDPDAQFDANRSTQRSVINDRLELSASYPLVLSNTMSFVVSGGTYAVNYSDGYSNPSNGAVLAYDTRVRAVFGQLSYTLSLPDTVRRLSILLAHGINGLGAQATARTNVAGLAAVNLANTGFSKVLLQASQANQWSGGFGSVISLMGQYSPHILPTTERISFGGLRMARGYAPGEASGDSGWGLGAELNRSFAVDAAYLKQIQPYLLLEIARVYNQSGTFTPSQLKSIAMGARLSDQKFFTVDVSVAKPVGDQPIENVERRPRFQAFLNYRLAP